MSHRAPEPIVAACCSCEQVGLEVALSLGSQPDPDTLLDRPDAEPAPEAPVDLAVCANCGLVQLVGDRPSGPRPPHGHAMGLNPDDPWPALIRHLVGARRVSVWDIDGSSGLAAAVDGGVVTGEWPESGVNADLIVAGHALSHVDDFDGLIRRIATSLAPQGIATFDFFHVLELIRGQFDVVSHAHRSYLSLLSLEHALTRHGLKVVAAQKISEYGGTVRVLAGHESAGMRSDGARFDLAPILAEERTALVTEPVGLARLRDHVRLVEEEVTDFLEDRRRRGRSVVGYGAASRGIALINIIGIGPDLLPLVVDRSPAKQGRYLPRSRIPVFAPEKIEEIGADEVVIFPWPLAAEIIGQLAVARDRDVRFVAFSPRLATVG